MKKFRINLSCTLP